MGGLANAIRALLNLLYPSVACLACSREAQLNICGLCNGCADELSTAIVPELTPPEPLMDARAAFSHEGAARQLVHSLKYDGLRAAAKPLGEAMAKLIDPSWEISAIVPVPLHRHRMRERGFNQSLDLAKVIGTRTGIAVSSPLERSRPTGTQTSLHIGERIKNVEGAFVSAPCSGSVLIVDDVFTTGSTVASCASALRVAGAARVYALTATAALLFQ